MIVILLLFFLHLLISCWRYAHCHTFVLFLFNHNNIRSSMLNYIFPLYFKVPQDLKPIIFYRSFWLMFVRFLTSLHVVLFITFPVHQSCNLSSCLLLYSFWASTLYSLTVWHIVSTLLPHNLQNLSFCRCCTLHGLSSILVLVLHKLVPLSQLSNHFSVAVPRSYFHL